MLTKNVYVILWICHQNYCGKISFTEQESSHRAHFRNHCSYICNLQMGRSGKNSFPKLNITYYHRKFWLIKHWVVETLNNNESSILLWESLVTLSTLQNDYEINPRIEFSHTASIHKIKFTQILEWVDITHWFVIWFVKVPDKCWH
jgi:hypothetical protein